VSVDGTKEVHDAQRTTKRGAGSYDSVICGIEHLKKAGLTVRVESVYTANHLSHNQGIVDTVDFLRSVGAEQVHLTPAIGKSGNDLVHINGISLGPDYEKATDSVMDSFLSDKPIKMQYIFYIIEALAQGGKEYLCDAGIKGLTVDTNGDVFPCYAVMHSSVSMGNVLDETFPGTTFAEVKGLLLASKKSTFAKCGRCWARTLCSSCYGDSFAAEKS
jgi:uncharacterized protein